MNWEEIMKRIVIYFFMLSVFLSACTTRKYLKPDSFEKIVELEYSPVQQQIIATAIRNALNKDVFAKFRKGTYYIEIIPLLGTEKEGRLKNVIPFLRKVVETGIGLNGGRIVETQKEADYIITILLDSIGIEIYRTNVLYIFRTKTNVGIVSGSFVLSTSEGQILLQQEFFGSSSNELRNVFGIDFYNTEEIKTDIIQMAPEPSDSVRQ
jgi:hypothetical protein